MKKLIYTLKTAFIAVLFLSISGQMMAQTPSITLIQPTNAGINWVYGGTYLISWTDNFQGTVDIYLSSSGNNWQSLATELSGTSWSWDMGTTAFGTNYKIKVQSHNNSSYADESVHPFSIVDGGVPGSITLNQPTGGESWASESTHLISWDDNLVVPVKVELLNTDGLVSTLISSTLGNSMSWTIPDAATLTPADDYKIKVSSTVSGGTSPATSAVFSIVATTGTKITYYLMNIIVAKKPIEAPINFFNPFPLLCQ